MRDLDEQRICAKLCFKLERKKITEAFQMLQQAYGEDCVRRTPCWIVKFATSRNLVVKNTMFPHPIIRKYTIISPDVKTHKENDNILIDRRSRSRILVVRIFRGADCDTDKYLVVTKVRKILARRKQAALKF